MLCALILYMNDGTYSLKSTLKDKIFEMLFMTILFTPRDFARNLLRESSRRSILLYFALLEDIPDLGFEPSNKPTHYLLHHRDCLILITLILIL